MGCNSPGATHHLACDCREDAICKEVAGLRERLAASEKAREEAERERDEFASAEDRERTRAECALVALAAAESRAARLLTVIKEIEGKTGHFGDAPPPPEWMPLLSLIAWVGKTARAVLAEVGE